MPERDQLVRELANLMKLGRRGDESPTLLDEICTAEKRITEIDTLLNRPALDRAGAPKSLEPKVDELTATLRSSATHGQTLRTLLGDSIQVGAVQGEFVTWPAARDFSGLVMHIVGVPNGARTIYRSRVDASSRLTNC